jgi:hypothetical protein
MARPWSRKRGGSSTHIPKHAAPAAARTESVQLDADAHAWWSQSEVERVWRPKVRALPEAEPGRDILAEHFGDDWRTNFGIDAPDDAELAEERSREQRAIDDRDPYLVLQVNPTATWEEIVAAHRHQARIHHPDRLFGQSEEEKAEGEDRIRVINAAYQELRIRRGM